MQYIFLFLLVHNSEFLENLIKSYCTRPHFDRGLVLNGLSCYELIKSSGNRETFTFLYAVCYFLPQSGFYDTLLTFI